MPAHHLTLGVSTWVLTWAPLGRSADEVTDDDDTYQSFECVVFTHVHLLNLKTVKVLGEEED